MLRLTAASGGSVIENARSLFGLLAQWDKF